MKLSKELSFSPKSKFIKFVIKPLYQVPALVYSFRGTKPPKFPICSSTPKLELNKAIIWVGVVIVWVVINRLKLDGGVPLLF